MEIKLNLVPPYRREEIEKRRKFNLILRAEFFLTAILVFFISILLSFVYILDLNSRAYVDDLRKKEETDQYKKIRELERKFQETNSLTTKIIQIKEDQLYWSKLFLKLSKLSLPSLEIFSVSSSDYFIKITGISDTREDLILFKEKLGGEPCFSNVDLPLSNLVNKNNVDFEINLTIDKNCLKK